MKSEKTSTQKGKPIGECVVRSLGSLRQPLSQKGLDQRGERQNKNIKLKTRKTRDTLACSETDAPSGEIRIKKKGLQIQNVGLGGKLTWVKKVANDSDHVIKKRDSKSPKEKTEATRSSQKGKKVPWGMAQPANPTRSIGGKKTDWAAQKKNPTEPSSS